MKFHVMTLFPEMIENGLNTSILGRAASKGVLEFHTVNMRDYTQDKHGKVDDYPYGGGAGMLIQAQPVFDAYQSIVGAESKKIRTIYLTPQGRTFDQKFAKELANEEELVFLCGHYEGVDERVLKEIVTDYVSIGDYVLTGGELPVMVMIDAISRMVPGVLNNDVSAETETFHNDLLEYPQYTRPEIWHEKSVPEVLLSGNHKKITEWRLEQSVERTKNRRPDLYAKYQEKQMVIKRLLKQKRTYIHMAEFLERGLGELYYADGFNICMGNSNVTLLSAQSEKEAVNMLEAETDNIAPIIYTPQEFVKDGLLQSDDSWKASALRQACYTNKVPLHVAHKDIRVSADGTMVAYKENIAVAELRIALNGSLELLTTKWNESEKTVIQSLYAFAINKQIFDMQTPVVQVEANNTVLCDLLAEMGLYFSEKVIWKIKNSNLVL